jgi:predicted metal-dependent TIM-barrel fold hydrolase
MKITVDVPDEEVSLVVELGETGCNYACSDECRFMNEQLVAMLLGMV